jgi:superfamily II DNA/RNA helicase
LLHNFRHQDKMEKVISALHLSGFQNPTLFQTLVFPAIFSGRDLLAETNLAQGVVTSYILPQLTRQFPKRYFPSTLILTDSLSSVKRIENNYLLINNANQFKTSLAVLGSDKTPGNDLPSLKKKPCIIIGITSRIIDHIRRNNINPEYVDTLIIDIPDTPREENFVQNILFIASKLKKKIQILIFVDKVSNIYELKNIQNHPKTLLYTDRGKLDIMQKGEVAVDKEKLELKIDEIIQNIKANPEDLAEHKRVYKKKVPIFLRSYFAAQLLKDLDDSSPVKGRKIPTGNMQTLFVSIGRRRKVHPKDLMKLFQKALDIKSTEIGPIKVLDNYSFIDLEGKLCKKAVDQMNGMEYRGRKISVDFAKKR